MLKTLTVFTLAFLVSKTNYSQELESRKAEAREFSLNVIKSYFGDSCDSFYDRMSDTLLIINKSQIIEKKYIKEKICESFSMAVKDKNKSFEDYLKQYEIEVLSIDELEKKFGKKISNTPQLKESDLVFLGGQMRSSANTSTENFIWDDMFGFLVRKENGVWVLKAFGD